MSNYLPLSSETHRNWRWTQTTSYGFAARDDLAPITAPEALTAALTIPLAFARQGDDYLLVAMQGFGQQRNLYVGSDGGWLGTYIPAVYRGYPFAFLKDQAGTEALCFDEASGQVGQQGASPLFDDEGKPSASLTELMNFAVALRQGRELTSQLCKLLSANGLIEPWPIKLKLDATDAQPKDLAGLFRINEAALNGLADEEFLKIRHAGALPLIYCQLLSMRNLEKLRELAVRNVGAVAGLTSGQGILGNSGTISFENL